MVLNAKFCAKIPVNMTFAQGATMSAVYCTAMYCLEDTVILGKQDACDLPRISVHD
jgi:NADPH:quinone reductase-like Zn-dependent oxidoreductase